MTVLKLKNNLPTFSKRLMEHEEVDDTLSTKTAPSQSRATEKAYTVPNVTYSETTHAKPLMIHSGYATIGPEEVVRFLWNWIYNYRVGRDWSVV